MFAEVAVNVAAVGGTFHYRLPDDPDFPALEPGHLVTVPFAGRRAQGIVVALQTQSPVAETKAIEALLDDDPVLTPSQIALAHWLTETYLTPLVECLTLMLPPGLSQQTDSLYRLTGQTIDDPSRNEHRLMALLERRGALRGRQIARSMSRQNWRKAADHLVRLGAVERRSVLQPPKVSARRVRTARLAVPPETARAAFDRVGHTPATRQRRQRMLEVLINEGEPLEVTWLYAEAGGQLSDLYYLEALDLVALGEAEVWRDPLENLEYVPRHAPRLTEDQQSVWRSIQDHLPPAGDQRPVLLHGVTGSGKTELYLRAVEATLERRRRALVLVPEIALTPQTVRRFLARFPGRVGLVHSQLTDGERYDTWRRARLGQIDIVIGPRSALFTPLPDIGLIVLDESHDESYKEEGRAPRYHARHTAMAYAGILKAACLLGSATPDLVTRFLAEQGQLRYLTLQQRILGHSQRLEGQSARLGVASQYQPADHQVESIGLPPVRVVDMRQELKAGNNSLFSRPLRDQLERVLSAGQQAILFLNRRGSSTYVFCRDCGWAARCPRCDRPLAHHPGQDLLRCHHCGYQRRPPTECPQCGSDRVRHFGAGTQRVEHDLAQLFPQVQTLRWDSDTTRQSGAHEVILAHFQARRAQVLIGTQMVAKGLDLPLVTLVGVISADTGLHLPDFRASERTFQLLTQVAGRAGRGLLGGQVVLQTYQPDHYAIQAASRHDYQAFYQQELSQRQALGYPPYWRLAKLVYRHTSAERAESEAQSMADIMRHRLAPAGLDELLIGPVPCFFERLRGEYRWQLVVRAEQPADHLPPDLPEGWSVDVDPVSLL